MDDAGEFALRLQALEAELREHPSGPLVLEFSGVARSLGVFTGNAAELRVTLSEGQAVPRVLEISDVNHRDRLDAFLDELDRLLHNYLASAYTLARHTAVLRDQHMNDDLTDEYEQRSPFASTLHRFVAELRNVTQHRVLPVVQLNQRLGQTSYDAAFVLHRASLLRDKLGGAARGYVDSLDADPRLDAIVDEYTLSVEQFTSWVLEAVVAANGQVMAERMVLRSRLDELFRSESTS